MRVKTAFRWLYKALKTLWHEAWFSFFDTFSRRGGWVEHFEGRAFTIQPLPFALTQCISGIIPLLLILRHSPAHLQMFLLKLFGFKISVGTFFAAWMVSRYFPIIINERGLRGRNLLGEARRVRWEQIKSAKRTQWMGVAPTLRISTFSRANVVWLPLYLNRQSEFEALVRQWAPEGNPLRDFFEK